MTTARPNHAVQEIRTLVEQDGANVVIGPLSGDEAIAVANYAMDHPDVTFIDGIAGARTRRCRCRPNFFQFHGDGAQWNAGLGYTVRTGRLATPSPSSPTTTASAGRRPPVSRRLLRRRW